MPSLSEWGEKNVSIGNERLFDNMLVFILDGTSLKMQAPKLHKPHRATWCNYKQHHCYRCFVATTLNGEIVFVSGLSQGRTTDHVLLQTSGFLAHLDQYSVEEAQALGFYGLAIGGDKGYVMTSPPTGWSLIVPGSGQREIREPSVQLFPEIDDNEPAPSISDIPERIIDSRWAQPRAVVEIAIERIKRFRKLANGSLRYLDNVSIYSDRCLTLGKLHDPGFDTSTAAPRKMAATRRLPIPSQSARDRFDLGRSVIEPLVRSSENCELRAREDDADEERDDDLNDTDEESGARGDVHDLNRDDVEGGDADNSNDECGDKCSADENGDDDDDDEGDDEGDDEDDDDDDDDNDDNDEDEEDDDDDDDDEDDEDDEGVEESVGTDVGDNDAD